MSTVHYVEFVYPGLIVSESESRRVDTRDSAPALPESAEGYRFYSRTEVREGDEVLVGQPRDFSPWVYVDGDLLAVEDVLPGSILHSNMKINGYAAVVRTRRGSCYPLADGDTVLQRVRT